MGARILSADTVATTESDLFPWNDVVAVHRVPSTNIDDLIASARDHVLHVYWPSSPERRSRLSVLVAGASVPLSLNRVDEIISAVSNLQTFENSELNDLADRALSAIESRGGPSEGWAHRLAQDVAHADD